MALHRFTEEGPLEPADDAPALLPVALHSDRHRTFATRIAVIDSVPRFVEEVELEQWYHPVDDPRPGFMHESWTRLEVVWGGKQRTKLRQRRALARRPEAVSETVTGPDATDDLLPDWIDGAVLVLAQWPWSLDFVVELPFKTYCKDDTRRRRDLNLARLPGHRDGHDFLEAACDDPQQRFGRDFLPYDFWNREEPLRVAALPESRLPRRHHRSRAAKSDRRDGEPKEGFIYGICPTPATIRELVAKDASLFDYCEMLRVGDEAGRRRPTLPSERHRGLQSVPREQRLEREPLSPETLAALDLLKDRAIALALAGPTDFSNHGSGSWRDVPVAELARHLLGKLVDNHERRVKWNGPRRTRNPATTVAGGSLHDAAASVASRSSAPQAVESPRLPCDAFADPDSRVWDSWRNELIAPTTDATAFAASTLLLVDHLAANLDEEADLPSREGASAAIRRLHREARAAGSAIGNTTARAIRNAIDALRAQPQLRTAVVQLLLALDRPA